MDLSASIEYLNSFINHERSSDFAYPEAFKLDRMRMLARALGNPQNHFESVIIAGSKGKGSTAAFLASILRMENYRVGLYTSPHLVELGERIRVNGLMLGPGKLVEYVHLIRQTLDSYEWRKDPPTYFEVLTAIALRHFREMKVHVAVLEVGLGGLYDSTNIVEARAVGLAPISLEHTDKLGKTIAKIAVQKCGVIKGREQVISAPQTEEARAVIEKTCRERDAELLEVGRDIRIFEREFGEDFQRFDLRAPFGNFFALETGLLGRHQMANAAVAVGLARRLEKRTRLHVSDDAVRQGVLDARWPGRLERLDAHPLIVADGAHNPASMSTALEGLRRHFHFNHAVAVLALSSDKDAEGILRVLLPETEHLIVTRSENPRALDPRLLAQTARALGREALVEPDATQALARARALAGPDDLILITGSLFLIGELKSGALA